MTRDAFEEAVHQALLKYLDDHPDEVPTFGEFIEWCYGHYLPELELGEGEE